MSGCRAARQFLHLAVNDGVFGPVDESILCRLVTRDAELGIHVVLEFIIVAVQVVRRDVQQDGDVGFEVIHVIQLERTEFNHIVVVIFMRHLQRQGITDVSCQTDIESGLSQDIEDEGGRRGFSVRTGNANHLRMCVARSELNLRDDGCLLCHQFLNQRCRRRDTRRFHHLVGIQDQVLRMLSVFPCYAVLIQQCAVWLRDRSAVGNEHIEAFLFRQDSGTTAGFTGSQNNNSLCHD